MSVFCRWRQHLLMAVALPFVLATGASAQESKLESAQAAGSIAIGTVEGMPMSGLTADGQVDGYVLKVLADVLAGLGISQIQPTLGDYKGLIPGLQANRWDIAAAGLDITSARCDVVIYSHPLTINTESFAIKKGNPKGIVSYDSLKQDSSLVLAVIAGSSQASYASGVQEVPAAQLFEVPSERGVVDAVLAGRADAGASGTQSIKLMTDNDNDRELVENLTLKDVPMSASGLAFRKSDKELRDAIDGELDKLRETGKLTEMALEWGVADDPEGLKTVRRDQISSNCE